MTKAAKEKKEKPRLIKYLNNGVFEFIKELKDRKETFTAAHTSYTCLINLPRINTNYFFMKESGNKESMYLCTKIKSEIKKSNIHVDGVRSSHVKYFNSNDLQNCSFKKVYNVDITNCYPTTLRNLGFITEKLFQDMEGMDKLTKLKAIGQIATRKTIYEYVEGVAVNLNIKTDELLRNVWFTICQETGESIYECQQAIDSFLFFWFDGIYFKNKKDAEIITEILTRRGYKCKFEVLENFKVKRDLNNLRINYSKGTTTKNFILPLSNNITYN